MAAQTEDKKLDGAGLSVLWGLIKNIIPTVPTNVSSFTNDAAYVSLLDTHNQNLVLASPNGASGLPSFRALAASDIPDLSGTYLTSASLNGYATQSWVTSQGFGTVSSIKVGTTSYSPSSGVVSLPAYPTTLPASDVYSWAKQSSKPSYSYSEISGTPSSLPASDVYSWAKAANKPSYTLDEVSDGSTRKLANYLPLSGGEVSGNSKSILYLFGLKNKYHASDSSGTTGCGIKLALGAASESNKYASIYACAESSWENTVKLCFEVKDSDSGVFEAAEFSSRGELNLYPKIKSKWTSGIVCTYNNMNANQGMHFKIGKSTSSYNAAQFGYFHIGDGSTNNYAYIGFHSADVLLAVRVDGNVGIGTNSPSYKLHVDGAVGATAFTNTSDIRNKDFISDTSMSIVQIANAPSFLFRWKTGDDRNVHAGSSAQYWQTVLPEIITAAQDEQRTLSMQYDVIALLSAITIAKEVVNDKERISQLEQRVSQLEAQLAN